MNTLPRFTELLLSSLGARDRFRDPLLGDLTEEFFLRSQRDGRLAARGWYYRQAAYAVPHLLLDWGRSLGGAGLRRLASVTLGAYMFTMMLAFLVAGFTSAVGGALGFTIAVPRAADGLAPVMIMFLPVELLCATCGGYIAAWLDRRAPMASAVTLGLSWAGIGLLTSSVAALVAPGSVAALTLRLLLAAVMVAGATLGGVLRMRALIRRGTWLDVDA